MAPASSSDGSTGDSTEDESADREIEWLSTLAAAERVGVTQRTLYRFINEGQLPAFKFGRVIRLKKADVDTYIESCRVEPGSMSHLYPETAGSSDD
ncbi:MAG: helix-turn-helix domain-containing protein [Acidimicrobiales bacterium]